MEGLLLFIKGALAAVGGFIVYWLGGLDQLLIALIAMVVLDYMTGLLAAWHNKTLSSAVGFRGIAKKVMLLGVVALAYIIERITSDSLPLREIAIMFFVVNEALSVLENAAKTGLPIPDKLKEVLQQLKGKGAENE